MEKKKCNFCKSSRKKINKFIYLAIYVGGLAIWGQIELIKYIIKLFNL
jgi:hypothetical protein